MGKLWKEKSNEYFSSLILATAIFFMLCIYEPLNMFFQNQMDYPCDFYDIFPECLGMFLVLTAGAAIGLLAVWICLQKWYHYLIGLLLWGYVCLYIQGNYMISELPLLDGQFIEWSQYRGQTIVSACFWLAMLVLCVVAVLKIKRGQFIKLAKYVGIFVSLVLLVTGVTVGVSKNGFEKRLELASTSKNMLDYSSDTNFILLVMDSMDSVVENQILEIYPEYREAFSDFTYYDNVTPGYLYTIFELPYLYGGEWYKGETDFDDYLDEIYLRSEFVQELQKRNYRLQAFTADVPLNTKEITKYENVMDYKSSVVDHVAFCKVMLRMSGYKYAPYALKKYTQVLPGELYEHLRKPEGIRVWNFADTNIPFYRECTTEKFEISKKKCFKMIHLAAAHYPFEYLKDVTLVQYSSYEDNMACSNTIIETYLQKLKDEGIYDNSVIFITADHSISPDNDEYKRMRPVLLVKGIGEHHDEMQTSSAPVTHGDFQAAYMRLLDGAGSREIFDCQEGDERERVLLFGMEPGKDLVEYIQTGAAYDVDTLYETGKVYSTK